MSPITSLGARGNKGKMKKLQYKTERCWWNKDLVITKLIHNGENLVKMFEKAKKADEKKRLADLNGQEDIKNEGNVGG